MSYHRTNLYPLAALVCSLLLTSCQESETPGTEPPAAPASPPPSQSIIRPEVTPFVEEPEAPLEPLEVIVGFPNGLDLSAEAEAALDEVLHSPQLQDGGVITLRGHSDSAGSDAANLRASERRAEAVRDWLVERGVAEDRFTLIALGEQNPTEPNALPDGTPNEAGRMANRRVEVVVQPAAPSASPVSPQLEASANNSTSD